MSNWLHNLQVLLYDVVVRTYFIGIKIASLWNGKAKKWKVGRHGIFEEVYHQVAIQRSGNQKLVWMHCASLGEFEQGRPLLERLRKEYPNVQILLSFFSPSGYEIRKNYPVADWVAYLPEDTAYNAKQFLRLVKPDVAVFVKYEFWYHYLHSLSKANIPTLLISSIFSEQQPFFKWYGGLHRRMLLSFRQILVQDDESMKLLSHIGIKNISVAGDTRVDRVLEIAENPIRLPLVNSFCQDAKVLVCGSTWPVDEALLYPVISNPRFEKWKFILAPHEIQNAHLQDIKSRLPIPFIQYSSLDVATDTKAARVLLIDNIGLLSSLYQFGTVAYIGGGFGQGIHNTLEPAAFGLPIVFGPKYQKFEEAKWMVANGAAFAIHSQETLFEALVKLENTQINSVSGAVAAMFIEKSKGGTTLALNQIAAFLA